MEPEKFPDDALGAVSIRRARKVLFGNSQAQPGMVQSIGCPDDQKIRMGALDAPAKNVPKFVGGTQTAGSAKAEP